MLLMKLKLRQLLLKLVACYLSPSLLIIIPVTIRFIDVHTNPRLDTHVYHDISISVSNYTVMKLACMYVHVVVTYSYIELYYL